MIAALAAIVSGGALIWIVAIAIVAIGGPADEALGDDESRLSDAQRAFFNANLYATLPLLALITLAMLHLVAVEYQTGLRPACRDCCRTCSRAGASAARRMSPPRFFSPAIATRCSAPRSGTS